ncbi:monoheme cytochrome C [Arenibacter palladensis]|uniref:monoheme cytochrome C n=1 Tax=Arenibacter palladensis TaxID=237373 RepID=UPI0026E25F35|nr:monoheme cytochrome C [Arenibacter palladensis]MDO6601969.1 monoheme cytochrome C [Arenibacter palladensis]
MSKQDNFRKQVKSFYSILVVSFAMVLLIGVLGVIYMTDPSVFSSKKDTPNSEVVDVNPDDDWDKIENGIHLRTGFKEGEGLMTVVNNCTNCHSAQLVIQNRMNEERWIETIRWMQKTQNLWDLGDNEKVIVNYLVTNYPPKSKGRREALTNIEWYPLEE